MRWLRHHDAHPSRDRELLIVEEGSLYPALHRMEQNGCVRASWAITVRAHARWPGPVGQPRKELGAVVNCVDAMLRFA
jgi:hypothetical protein